MAIFTASNQGGPEYKARAWGASLVLIFLVLTIRLSTKWLVAWRYGGKETHV
jgi:ABC-type phosphate transport system permease subunit